jgi:hypothetical protein
MVQTPEDYLVALGLDLRRSVVGAAAEARLVEVGVVDVAAAEGSVAAEADEVHDIDKDWCTALLAVGNAADMEERRSRSADKVDGARTPWADMCTEAGHCSGFAVAGRTGVDLSDNKDKDTDS